MKQRPFRGADRSSVTQEIPCILWNRNVHYPIHKSPTVLRRRSTTVATKYFQSSLLWDRWMWLLLYHIIYLRFVSICSYIFVWSLHAVSFHVFPPNLLVFALMHVSRARMWWFLTFSQRRTQANVFQNISLSGCPTLFIEICSTPCTDTQSVEKPLSMPTMGAQNKRRRTSTRLDVFEIAIQMSGFRRQDKHWVVRLCWLECRKRFLALKKLKVPLHYKNNLAREQNT
jgi:hypothetical protein